MYEYADDLAITHADGDWQAVEGVLSKDMATVGHAIHCFSALNLGADVEQPFDCLIIQNRQAVESMGRSVDWTLEDDMLGRLFFCATLTGRRGGHTPFVQAGAETSDTGAEAVKPDPRCSWEGHSGRMSVGDEST